MRASLVAAHSAQPTLAKSSERSSLTSRPEGLVAGGSPSILDWRGWGWRTWGGKLMDVESQEWKQPNLPKGLGEPYMLVSP